MQSSKVNKYLNYSFLLLTFFLIPCDCIFAEQGQVKLRIRTLEAFQLTPSGDAKTENRLISSRKIIVPANIQDLRGKLATLPYQSFRLLNTQERQVPLNNKTELELEDGHKLYVKPVSKHDKKVCLWLRWNDDLGAEILDTRMHLTMGQSMITGTEKHENTGVILAVDVSPVE